MNKPTQKPNNPLFSSGPCAKRPGWSLQSLENAILGRSHRAGPAKAKLKEIIEKSRELLNIPADYKIGIVPASDTGAVEMALWSLLGQRDIDVLSWESFSQGWLLDITKQLQLENVTAHKADYGDIVDLSQVNFKNDVVFCWNGTTSGVCVPDGNWIADEREGLTICDATSAAFSYPLPFEKLDVTTWSWQKAMGGEAAHGMIVLSPKAVQRLETYTPKWPLPKIFRMTKNGKLIEGIFEGATINTPSMLAVEDCLDVLNWMENIGGINQTIKRTQENYHALKSWVENQNWIDFLCEKESVRSQTSVCLKITDEWFLSLPQEKSETAYQGGIIANMCKLLEKEGAAFDIKSYRDAPPGLRIWCGATIETQDVEALTHWIEWAYLCVKEEHNKKAA